MKFFYSILCFALIASLAGCKKQAGPDKTTTAAKEPVEEAPAEAAEDEKLKEEKAARHKELLEAIEIYRNAGSKSEDSRPVRWSNRERLAAWVPSSRSLIATG